MRFIGFGRPEFQTCCAHGKIKRIPPAPLYNLFTGDGHDAKDFRTNIVQYYTSFGFTSLGVIVDQSVVAVQPVLLFSELMVTFPLSPHYARVAELARERGFDATCSVLSAPLLEVSSRCERWRFDHTFTYRIIG